MLDSKQLRLQIYVYLILILNGLISLEIIKSETIHEVTDPLGKYSADDKTSFNKMFEKWNNPNNYPPVKMTVKQAAWFYSLGCSNITQNQGLKFKHESETPFHKNIRKEYRLLSGEERHRLNHALNTMKQTLPDPDDYRSEYDLVAGLHRKSVSPSAHGGPGFLVWHREYIWR